VLLFESIYDLYMKALLFSLSLIKIIAPPLFHQSELRGFAPIGMLE